MTDGALALRRATVADLDRLVEIEALCFLRENAHDALAAELVRSWARVLVCESDGVVTAFVDLWRVADEVEVHFVATHPAWRRNGHASTLLGHALEEMRREGAVVAMLEVRASNAGALELYRRHGFVDHDARRAYYDDGEDALGLRAELRGAGVSCRG